MRTIGMDPRPPRHYRRPPPAWRFMAEALLPRRRGAPPPRLTLGPVRPDPAALADYLRLTGETAADTLPLLFVQVWSFRLQVATITHRDFPLPIWQALQVRNRLHQHRPIARDATVTMTVQAMAPRALDKGTEIDLVLAVDDAGGRAFDAVTTFYWRGRRLPGAVAGEVPASPAVDGPALARWPSGGNAGACFGRLTGDHNPLHRFDGYARRQGFPAAFHHPHRVVGQALAHLGDAAPPLTLDLWIRGPVPYGSELVLRRDAQPDGERFALHLAGDARPAIVGWRAHRNFKRSGL